MADKLQISNVIFTNELILDELINDYAYFVATKLFEERGVIDEKK